MSVREKRYSVLMKVLKNTKNGMEGKLRKILAQNKGSEIVYSKNRIDINTHFSIK